ncbi:cdc42 homolog isoform X2 [Photinus pyralis]|uniref:cdc42 homolog isoform X2 n=1 Tax=Photinus pyralis TaxID=7054 RepID=UPI00126770CD|nr:cdc42 homolog isoform X2 [Photinus pyralis]
MALKSLKCVVLGDGTVGKTCLLMRYTTDEFLSDYVPTVFENYAASTLVGDEVYDVHLFDTAGQEAYNHLRKLTLEQADVIVVCFSVDLWNSFINVKEKWIPELQEHYSKIPFMVVGTKIDLRFDTDTIEKLTAQGRKPITKEEGEVLAKELSANAYLECSALTRILCLKKLCKLPFHKERLQHQRRKMVKNVRLVVVLPIGCIVCVL